MGCCGSPKRKKRKELVEMLEFHRSEASTIVRKKNSHTATLLEDGLAFKKTMEGTTNDAGVNDREDEWGFDLYGDVGGDTSGDRVVVEDYMPPQLHPAVHLGIHRVSSGLFFSSRSEASNSVADLLSLLDEPTSELASPPDSPKKSQETHAGIESRSVQWDASDVLYHDIMVHVLNYLDADSLMEFSQTARRPNFECFYFLQLQLQKALLVIPDDSLQAMAGSGCVSRLAQVDEPLARQIVKDYSDSNSTLRTMPLSHSLAYVRRLLQRNGFQQHVSDGSPSNTLAAAALLITLVGAASFMSGQDTAAALPNTLFRMGLAGSLVRAAQTTTTPSQSTMRETAEQMARMMQELPSQLLQQIQQSGPQSSHGVVASESLMSFPGTMASRIYSAFSSAYEANVGSKTSRRTKHNREPGTGKEWSEEEEEEEDLGKGEGVGNSMDEIDETLMKHPLTDPYEHFPGNDSEGSEPNRHKPSGCVGAYLRAVRRATNALAETIKQERRDRLNALSEEEQQLLALSFIDACSSDDSFETVRHMVQGRQIMDVDGFYVGPDGSESCALHTAAFHGASKVLEFLCRGIDEHDASNDGGLASVNLRDSNGWTALHFAAGANSVSAVRVLANHGAELLLEANNGYTPFHWAQRLSNHDVANELQKLGADQRFLEIGWLRQQPFSVIASRFFSTVPTH